VYVCVCEYVCVCVYLSVCMCVCFVCDLVHLRTGRLGRAHRCVGIRLEVLLLILLDVCV
jgi:hypothetical protein